MTNGGESGLDVVVVNGLCIDIVTKIIKHQVLICTDSTTFACSRDVIAQMNFSCANSL